MNISNKNSLGNIIKNTNEKTIVFSMFLFSLIILILFSLYWLVYLRNLPSKECSNINTLYPKINGNIRRLNVNDPQCNHTFKDYYIKTAYNACSGGSYTNDYVSICVLKGILKQGVRALDFEIFSVDDQPVVATSISDNYFVKETFNKVDFSDVMTTIKNYAFVTNNAPNSSDPIIIHLRFKSSNKKMYNNFAKILKKYNDILLGKEYSFEYNKKNLGDVPLLNFMNKVVIIADMNNPSFLDSRDFYEYVNMTSNSLFMRALQYYDVQYSPDIDGLTLYNKQAMTIVMPDKGSNPPNISGLLARATGCQLLAMRYQLFDSFLEENELFFDTVGYAFVLKPETLRYAPIVITAPPSPSEKLNYETRTISSNYYNFNI